MCRARWTWAALLGAGLAAELHGIRTPGHHACTLTACTRSTLRTDHAVGRVVFAGGWVALSAWLVPHILRKS